MGMSANRRPGEMAQPQQSPVFSKTPLSPVMRDLPGSKPVPVMDTLQPTQPMGQPFQPYQRLQNFAHGSPFGQIFGDLLMQGAERHRIEQGMSPEEWQARNDARFAARRARNGF